MSNQLGEDGRLPRPHPVFAAHFTRPLYDPTDDESFDLPPFGTDEGFDELHDWSERASELRAHPTLRHMLGGPADPQSKPDDDGGVDDDIVIGLGFTLLRVTGQIDDEGGRWLRAALRRRSEQSPGTTVYREMLDDLNIFWSQVQPRPQQRRARWVHISGGWNDPAHAQWLKTIEDRLNVDPEWSGWWSHADKELLVLVPRPAGPPGGMIDFTSQRKQIEVLASSEPLTRLLLPLLEDDVDIDPDAGIHGAAPEAPHLFRRLIYDMTVQTAQHLRIPPPPPSLP